ncbi:HAMP domain-containing sensor histidine kinase [Vitiosangium sp. GDMCC 1.1324]|uniref:sensor histidine kinase n=1 Tax=Vitiosangium sp. (strain GDMCC 1.1324) TaxID=2138576 RepID=UPI000D35B505|nr:HAMP domain-containing sensor histidine kinase [Vitiosangium sp. GDMCC 1.1324]PTL84107.1 sensor histidine kinase [Vitiosangium sp. GDMCC 1.1324]
MSQQPPRPRQPRRMFWRIYGYGLLMLLATYFSATGAAYLVETHLSPLDSDYEAVQRLVTVANEAPANMTWELERIASETSVRATVYRTSGEMVATAARPPIPALDAGELAQHRRRWDRVRGDAGMYLSLTPKGGVLAGLTWRGDTPSGYVLMQIPERSPSPNAYRGMIWALMLLVLALVSIPLARALAGPVERLTGAVRDFGQGRLSARAELKGRDEVAELGRSFDEMAERMQLLIRSEKELLANVSHELRTPLARLGVTLDLAEEGHPDELARRLPDLRRDIGELQQLVEGVLQMARLDLEGNHAGQPGPRVRLEVVDPTAFLQETAERFLQLHPELPLTVEGTEGLPALRADGVLLRRALHNLLDNARKYSEAGSPVTLRAHEVSGALQVEVEDRGIGVAPEDLPRLSSPFFRTDRSRARGTGGVGLGLTLTRRIVEAHGGTLSIQSQPGERTRVTLRLPLEDALRTRQRSPTGATPP